LALMLLRLRVSNLAVVEKTEALFSKGLNVITGETGAGKSVLMGALELVLGGRADASVVREGAKEAEVEAEFEGATIRRTVTSQGRSRAWLNDESVSVSELKEFGAKQVDIHGPTANQRLLDEGFQRDALDSLAENSALLERYHAAYEKLEELKSVRAKLLEGDGEDELDMLRYQVEEISSASLDDDDETIGERHAAAAHAEEVVSVANAVTESLGGDERSVAETMIRLQPMFRNLSKHLPQAVEWVDAAEEIVLKVQELSRSVADAMSKLDSSDEDLDALDARLTLVNRLKRKYGGSVSEILEKLEKKRARLDELEHREERLAAINGEIAAVKAKVLKAGAELSASRAKAANGLSKSVTAQLHDLGFIKARLFVNLKSIEPASHGVDSVAYMFEPNPGEPPRPLAAIASSGEIARVMLAIKGVLAAHDSIGTMVFDEIDANVGGEAGRTVGEKLLAVAKHRQVIAITHLPQSAAFGVRHLVVRKTVSEGRTRTVICEVNGEERVLELARMLGGDKLTNVVKKHAEELLELSR